MSIPYHEPTSELSADTRDLHRALSSMKEELEAIDWYQQRADATQDSSLRDVLIHNRDEELEHAAMVLEWLRRRIPKLDEVLRTYLFTEQPIVAIEQQAEGGNGPSDSPTAASAFGSLGIGKFTCEG